MLTIKICGLSDEAGVDAALAAGADMVGFVFFEPSPRNITLDRAKMLSARAGGRARKVALTVDADDACLAAVIEALAPDLLQLHGQESPERVSYVRARFGLPVMRAIGMASARDLEVAARFAPVADALLFDARPPREAVLPGGNGEAFDWSLLRGFELAKPWFLAGGLHCDNVVDALSATGARGLDVSSGVETSPGVKSPEKIARFVALARNAAEALGSRGPIR